MKIEILNHQKIKRINLKKIKSYLAKIATHLNISSKKISFVFCDNRFIKDLNKRFFKENYPTDVISFSLSDELDPNYLGEVVVSVEEAVKVGTRYGNPWEKELVLYLTHGILHLCSYNDRTKREKKIIRKKEEEILKKIFKPAPKNK